MMSLENYTYLADNELYPVLIDGGHVGYVDGNNVENMIAALKVAKIEGKKLPKETEVAFMKKGQFKNTIYPMVYITTAPARFLRPVKYLPLDSIEWLSPF